MMELKIVPAIVGLSLITLGLFGSSRFLTPESVWGGGSAHAATGSAMPISCRDRMRTASRTEDTPFLDLDFAHRRYAYDGQSVALPALFEVPPKLRSENDVRNGVKFGEGGLQRPLRTEENEEHTSELQSLMRISYAVFCLKKQKNKTKTPKQCTTKQPK